MKSMPLWRWPWALVAFFGFAGCGEGDDLIDEEPGEIAALREQLGAIPGMRVLDDQPVSASDYWFFLLLYEQPVDHHGAHGGTFNQLMRLFHRDASAPVVLVTEGYGLRAQARLREPTLLVAANQLVVEHRFFGSSRPAPAVWDLMNLEQAASDHHRIVTALRPLYPQAWISTGVSKGGMTAVFFRRFFPADVDGTLAYVAPLTLGAPDVRYLDFFEREDLADCMEDLRAFQRESLARREAMEAHALSWGAQYEYSFTRLGVERVIEQSTVEFIWSFWQYAEQIQCANIPPAGASDDLRFAFLNQFWDVAFGTDQFLARYEPYYYQALVELGFPAIAKAHLDDLLLYEESELDPLLMPQGAGPIVFDPTVMQDIDAWVTAEGDRLLFVYGENDPWTAGAFTLGDASAAYVFSVPGGNHGAQLADLPAAEREEALAALGSWTGTAPDLAALRTTLPAPRGLRRGLPSQQGTAVGSEWPGTLASPESLSGFRSLGPRSGTSPSSR